MKISLAISTYNRFQFLQEFLVGFTDTPNIDEIIINDDCSADYEQLKQLDFPGKVKIYQNSTNLGALRNKIQAVSLCTNEWVILLDSDNTIGPGFIGKLMEIGNGYGFSKKTIYCPEKAWPNYVFTKFKNLLITKRNVLKYIDDLDFQILLNTGNYFFNRDKYLEIAQRIEPDYNPYGCDVIYFNHLWLLEGYTMYVLENLEYEHRVHDESFYLTTRPDSSRVNYEIIDRLKITLNK
jgi:glycosyltransferase involved in cell wall biosynthesis